MICLEKTFNMSITRSRIIAPAIAGLSATAAFSQGPAEPPGVSVTRVELQHKIRERFEQRDTNHDHVLTADELGERAEATLHHLDTNHDGKITFEEAAAPELAAFDAADTNHDGVLTPEERAAAARARAQH